MFFSEAHAATTIGLPAASTAAASVDSLHDFIWFLSIFFLIGVTTCLLYFVTAYNRNKKGRETAYILGHHGLELAWTVIPLILMLGIFAWGYKDYISMRKQLTGAVEINVVGRQWMWNFEYSNGRKTINELYLPKDTPIKLIMTSEDVLHSFYLPHMRIKQDTVPGMYSYLSFVPSQVGMHPVYCTEFCGTSHSDMLAKAIVLEKKEFENWLVTGKSPTAAKLIAENPNYPASMGVNSGVSKTTGSPSSSEKVVSLAEQGKQLSMTKGCVACHSDDGSRKVGPSYKGIWGTEVELADGSKVKIDENYIRQSIYEPQSQVVKGYVSNMPTFKGLINDQEMNAIIAYIKSLK